MSRLILTLLTISITIPAAFATSFTSTIHSIVLGKEGEEHLIKFDNSRVAFVAHDDEDLLQALEISRKEQVHIEVMRDRRNTILSAKSLETKKSEDDFQYDSSRRDLIPYKPTVFNYYNSALNIMSKMRTDYNKDGECYSRAHVWAYEEFKRSGLRSKKLFLFFTNRYIRNYRFHWWFHVTPMTYVGSNMRTLDKKYASQPVLTKTWTDIFIRTKRTCPLVKLYNTYALNQESQDCYLISDSMYSLIPRDIEKRDLSGKIKESFIARDVERSYRDAFNIDYNFPENTDYLK